MAQGGEAHVTVGNFRPPAELKVLERRDAPSESSAWAYVYLDGIKITLVDQPDDRSLNQTIAGRNRSAVASVPTRDVRWDAVLFDFI